MTIYRECQCCRQQFIVRCLRQQYCDLNCFARWNCNRELRNYARRLKKSREASAARARARELGAGLLNAREHV